MSSATRTPEVAFDEPWQARVFALALLTVEHLGLDWETFRERLKAAVASDPGRPYYDTWLTALEELVRDHGMLV